MLHDERYLLANWPAPTNIKAFVTTRRGGFSTGVFSSFNMGIYSGDNPATAKKNRAQLTIDWQLEHPPQWLKQVHGVDVIEAHRCPSSSYQEEQEEQEADAMFTREPGIMCTALTADCLPVLFCDRSGSVVASAHAGWKGLLAGVLENTVRAMGVDPANILVWLGPAISQKNFEVGPEVREQFIAINPAAGEAFIPGEGDRWFADIYQLARQRLGKISVTAIYGGGFCSVEQDDLFYSYRRDGKKSGRMASVIWLE